MRNVFCTAFHLQAQTVLYCKRITLIGQRWAEPLRQNTEANLLKFHIVLILLVVNLELRNLQEETKYVVNCLFRQTRYRGVITLSKPINYFIGLREALQ